MQMPVIHLEPHPSPNPQPLPPGPRSSFLSGLVASKFLPKSLPCQIHFKGSRKYRSSPVGPLLRSLLWLPGILGRKAMLFTEAAGSFLPSVYRPLCPPDLPLFLGLGSGPGTRKSSTI